MTDGIQLLTCDVCGKTTALPLTGCPDCGSNKLTRSSAGGIGVLYTWTTTYHVFDAEWGFDVPYTVGLVELDEGARIPARISEVAEGVLAAGMRLRLVPGQDRLTFQSDKD